MEEDRSFVDSEVGRAYDAWLTLSNDTLELTAAIPPAFVYVVDSVTNPNWRHINGILGGFLAGKTHDAAKNHVDNSFRTLYVLSLIGSWGAFEAYVEDVARAKLRTHPELATDAAFDRPRRRAAQLTDVTEDERFERMIREAVGNRHDALDADGNGKYESQLGLAGLNGVVPTDLAEAIMEAQQVRNVWTHNGGRADERLLRQAPNIGFAIGETVTITKPMLGKYLLGLNTYATIIVNRYRVQEGFAPLVCYAGEQNIFKASFDALFPNAILPVSLPDMSRRESDGPPT